MLLLSLIIWGLIFLTGFAEAGWIRKTIGWCPSTGLEGIEVANGRNDGIKRVYVVSRSGGIYEWTYSGGSWSYQTVYYSGAETYMPLTVGTGRNDGLKRLYTGEPIPGGKIREATFSGGWTSGTVQSSVGNVQNITIGDGRNDGAMRLYVACIFGLYEYTWTGSSWSKLVINSSIAGGKHDIGDGRNDGKNRIYCPDMNGPLYEFTWTGSSFSSSVINLPATGLCAAKVGPGRNDTKNRVYVSASLGHLYEVSYTGTWQSLDLTPSGPNLKRWGIRVGRTRSDGKERVYTTAEGGALTEFSWTGSAWKDSVVDAVSGATISLSIGGGRNDDTVRIYTGDYFTTVNEITNTSPYYGVAEETTNRKPQTAKLSAYPNPFTQRTVIRVQGLGSRGLINQAQPEIRICDIAGKVIRTLPIPNPQSPITEIIWNGEDDFGKRVESGVYFYRLENDGSSFIPKKLVVFRSK